MKKKASFTAYIPTIGYPLGKATRDLDLIIKKAIEGRRHATNDEDRDYYNAILEQAYKDKYADLDLDAADPGNPHK